MPEYPAYGRAAVFFGPGQPLEIRDIRIPEPEAREAIVRIECCTVCGSDLHTISGKRNEVVPSILGHEAIGIVQAVGDPAPCALHGQALRLGDRVTWSACVCCGECDRCRSGLPQKCRTVSKYGHDRAEGRLALSGGLAEYIVLRKGSSIVRIPESLPAELVCPANCATATVAAALRVSGDPAGRRVMIFGAGLLGLTATAWCRASGADRILVCDPDAGRREMALRFGADAAVDWMPDFHRQTDLLKRSCGTDQFDIILELSGHAEAVGEAIAIGDIAAQVVLVGSVVPTPAVPIDPERIVRRWLSIHGVHNYAPVDLQAAVGFLKEHHAVWPFAELCAASFPLDRVNDAVDLALRDRPVRVAICP